ncbi:MAG: KamA family radical SAM protein [Sphaerochaetaceae bacterium]|jgi:lysine 2,3-aminomutase
MEKETLISDYKELEKYITLTEQERAYFEHTQQRLPFLVSRYFLSLIDTNDPFDPIRLQVIPSMRELEFLDKESHDPLLELNYSVTNRLIHRYANRVALLLTDKCATYCRHCFRRRFTGGENSHISDSELQEVASYLKEHPTITEILITGGDPLMVSDTLLHKVISTLREASPSLVIRLGTRMVATYPKRITTQLIKMLHSLSTQAPMYIMVQFNHPRELTFQSTAALQMFSDKGFPLMNQSVLLKGVNDDVETLVELCNTLIAHKVKPYYLFQGDLVSGTHHLRVPLSKGLALERELRKRVSGLAMPQYALDLPEGGGKVPLSGSYVDHYDPVKKMWVFRTLDGTLRSYPE